MRTLQGHPYGFVGTLRLLCFYQLSVKMDFGGLFYGKTKLSRQMVGVDS